MSTGEQIAEYQRAEQLMEQAKQLIKGVKA
jgi:hypothetical protein